MVLSNLGRNLHLFLDNIEFRIENPKLSLGKTVLIKWSLVGRNMAYYFQNINLKKIVFSFIIFFIFFYLLNFFKSYFIDKLSHFSTYLRLELKKNPKHYFLFSIINSFFLSRKMCKLLRKLCNTKIYPLEVWVSQIIFFYVILWKI